MTLTNTHMQKHCIAIRKELGYPLTAPACHSLAFAAGGPVDIQISMDLARHAQSMGRDVIYAAWNSVQDAEPSEYVLALRGPLCVEIIRNCTFYCSDAVSPVIMVAQDRKEHFTLSSRLYFEQQQGLPGRRMNLGQRRAMGRIRHTATSVNVSLFGDNQFVPRGGSCAPSKMAASHNVVRFS